jgi:S1-C subfamily serine protease
MEDWTNSPYDPEPEVEMRRKTGFFTRGRLIVLFVLALIVMIGIWVVVLQSAGGITGVMDLLFGASPEMLVNIQAPPSVDVGGDLSLVINVQNLGDEILEIEEILIPAELLQAAVVTSIFPGSTNQHEQGGMTAFEIGYAVLPLESMSFTINLQAVSPIDFQGELQIKSGWRREEAGTRVVIIGPEGVAGIDPNDPDALFGPDVPYLSVVKIAARHLSDGQMVESWSGSGSIISPEGLILTNAHVVLPGHLLPIDELIIYMTIEPDQPPIPMYRAEVLQADPLLDIAVIRITTDLNRAPLDRSGLNLPTVPLGDASLLELGDPLTILGYPGIGGNTITLTRGSVSGFTSEAGYGDRAFIKTEATIAGGNSGGLVADESGQLVAIPTQVGSGDEGLLVDCRSIVDTNRDGVIDSLDTCVPTGGFINALRPIDLAQPLIEAASRGEVNIVEPPKPDIPLPVGDVTLASDDFSVWTSGWDHGSGFGSFVGYYNGEYHVEVDTPNYVVWGLTHGMFVDTVITVQARVVRPVGNADYGMICRYRDADNFYGFSITEDRYASIWKIEFGGYSVLMDWTFSQDIPQYEMATITVACLSNELTLAVNGVVLGRVSDFSFASGDVGLFGGAWNQPGFTVAFDNIEIKSP